MKTIAIIAKKELTRFFTDKRVLLGMIMPGILIYVLYSLMGTSMMGSTEPNNDYIIQIVNRVDELDNFFEIEGYRFSINEEVLTEEEILIRIKDKKIDAYIVFEENFYQNVLAYDAQSGDEAPLVNIYYNSSKDESRNFYQLYTTYLNQFETSLSNKFDVNRGETAFDQATEDDMSVMIISMMLPFLLMTFLFTGAMSICTESVAGEKERGTIATLLITPVKRYELAFGKIIALGLTSLVSALASFIGIMAALPALLGNEVSLGAYGLGTLGLVLLVIMVTVLLFTTLLTMISTYAKSVKEASSFAVPLMMVVMLVGVTGFMNTSVQTNPLMFLIPIYNSIQCFSGLLSLELNAFNLFLTIISNGVFIAGGIFILAKMFNSEKVMFNK